MRVSQTLTVYSRRSQGIRGVDRLVQLNGGFARLARRSDNRWLPRESPGCCQNGLKVTSRRLNYARSAQQGGRVVGVEG